MIARICAAIERVRTAPARFTRDVTTYMALTRARPEDVPAILKAHTEWEI